MSDNCPNCGKKYKGLMSDNIALGPKLTIVLNKYSNKNAESFCNHSSCGLGTAKTVIVEVETKLKETLKKINPLLTHVPIATIFNPLNWKYKTLGIVSSQSVTGTGIFSEISSGFADFVGGSSSALTAKIAGGEENCKKQLRYNAVNLGANAVLGTDIDYAEVGGAKGMIMVCMSGTAVKVENFDEVNSEINDKIIELSSTSVVLRSLLEEKALLQSIL